MYHISSIPPTPRREKLGVIIESAEIADAMKKIYELAWAEAKRKDAELRRPPAD